MTPDQILRMMKKAGGEDFTVFIQTPDVRQAFNEAVSDARYEHGSGGYTGTIAEKSGYTIRSQTPMTREQAWAFVDKDLENNDKWGPAFAVPVAAVEKASTKTKKVKLKVAVKSDYDLTAAVEKAVREKLGTLGANVHLAVKIESKALAKGARLPELKAVKASKTYWTVVGGTWSAPTAASRADAVKALKDSILRERPRTGTVYTVQQVKQTDVITVGDTSRSLDTYEVVATVTLTTVKTMGKIQGWIFYGVASS